ncbi:auxin response factor 7-like isoform X2 [Euphorbia lathyris]|uniref:auxin response factor 7-like isoform X2 n=1 Tax=Euphorbia lathyris TaxID=212925 RepID=UPI00331405CC
MESAANKNFTAGNNDEGRIRYDAFYKKMCYDGYIYEKLWHSCAGLLDTLPTAGGQVYYFPQGQIEQLGVPLDDLRIPNFNLPSRILCRVIHVHSTVEPKTGELFARITLLPEQDQREVTSSDPECPEDEAHTIHSFFKTLTTSDLRTLECLCIDSVHAETFFPPLDMSQLEPWQDLVATDISGKEWHFRHIVSGDPMCHLLSAGWSEFASSKRLLAGDSLIFLREENGRLRVGVKTHKQLPTENKMSSIMPVSSICMGVFATASHALSTGTLFSVLYSPRKSQSDFIVKVNKYMEAQHHNFSDGMRFSMRFEADQIYEKSSLCTIVGGGDISQMWSNSKWRCLKVSWDGWDGLSVMPPERVSPWELEPVIALTDHGTWIFPVEAPKFPYSHHLNSPSSSPTTSNTNSCSFSEESSPTSVSLDQLASDAESIHSMVGECSTQSSDAAAGSDNISDGSNNSRSAIPSNCCELEEDLQSNQIRTYTKIRMQGVIVGRSVDMTSFTCHEDLLRKLEMMFEIEGELSGSTKQWLVVYTDAAGETKTVEDYPWGTTLEESQVIPTFFLI